MIINFKIAILDAVFYDSRRPLLNKNFKHIIDHTTYKNNIYSYIKKNFGG